MIPFAPMPRERSDVEMRKAVLIFALFAVFALSAWLIGGLDTVITLLAVMATIFVLSPAIGVATVMRLHRARPLTRGEAGVIHRINEELAARAGLRRAPGLYVTPSESPGAFSMGSADRPAIAFSRGGLHLLNRRELTGVLAHEIAHIANGDGRLILLTELIRRMTGAAAMVGLALILALAWSVPGVDLPVWVPVALTAGPAAAFLLQRALFRTLEFAADLGAVELTHDAYGLAAALWRIEKFVRMPWLRLFGRAPDDRLPALFRTHPTSRERIRRLAAL